MTTPRISVCIVCRNEAEKLDECLASAAWADELVIVDLESTDDSAAVARRHGARVVSHPVVPIVELVRNVAADAADGQWILALDPDERVEPGLARALRELAQRDDVDVVEIPVMNLDLGFPATHEIHRYDPKPRLYRRDRLRWPEQPNELPDLSGLRVHRLPARDELVIRHERNRNLVEILDRVVRYAPAEARAMVEAGERFAASSMLRVLGGKAYKQFIRARPWQDGAPGFFRAGILVAFHFYVWLEFWRESGAVRTPEDDRTLRRVGTAAASIDRVVRVAVLPSRMMRRLRGTPPSR